MKSYDRGNSNIPAKEFRQHLRQIGLKESTYFRWLDQALQVGLIKYDKKYYSLICWEGAAKIVGCDSLKRPILLSSNQFINKGWLAWVWSGYLLHFRGKPVTRYSLEKLSGIPSRTQISYENKAGVDHIENYADLFDIASDPDLAIELLNTPGYYQVNGRVRQRLGNTYLPQEVKLANIGRTKQINKALRSEGSSQSSVYLLYCLTQDEYRRKLRKIRRVNDAKNCPIFLYQHRADIGKVSVWHGVAI